MEFTSKSQLEKNIRKRGLREELKLLINEIDSKFKDSQAIFDLGTSFLLEQCPKLALFCFSRIPCKETDYIVLANIAECLRLNNNLEPAYIIFKHILSNYNPEGEIEKRLLSISRLISVDESNYQARNITMDEIQSKALFMPLYKSAYSIKQKFRVSLTREEVDSFLQKNFENLEFIPSFTDISSEINLKHIIHLHVPKAGGMKLSNPIVSCLNKLRDTQSFQANQSIIVLDRISETLLLDAYAKILQDFDSNTIKSISGGYSHIFSARSLEYTRIYRKCFPNTACICFTRNPTERLISALNYLYRVNNKDVSKTIEDIKRHHQHLDNPIARLQTQNYNAEPDELYQSYISKYNQNSRIYDYKEVDILKKNISTSVTKTLQINFLSNNQMPNLLTNKVINKTEKEYKLDEKILTDLLNYANEQKLNLVDEHIYRNIEEKGDNLISSITIENQKGNQLADTTYIYISNTRNNIIARQALIPTTEVLSFLNQYGA